MEIMWRQPLQFKPKTLMEVAKIVNVKARTTEIHFEMGTWRKCPLQLQMLLAGCQPRLICKMTDVLGRKGLGLLMDLSHSQVSLEHHQLLQLWLWPLMFRDDYAIPHLFYFF